MIKTWLITVLVIVFIAGANCGGGGGGSSSGSSGPIFSIVTNPATNITQTSAILNGRVNPNGIVTSAYFKYGTTPACSNSTLSKTIGAGTSDVVVTTTVTGLSGNTLYYFKVAVNRGGITSYGSNQTFTTDPPPPTCTTNPATNITTTLAKLNGTVNPNGAATNTYFEYGITSTPIAYSISTTPEGIGSGTTNVAVSATVNSLTPNTLYNFRIVATNNGGTNYGNNLIFITGNSPGSPPTCITDPASNVISNSARLNGTVIPNGVTTDAYFEYGISTTPYPISTTLQPIGSGIISVALSATASSLTPNTLYNFRVVGTNGSVTTYGNNLTFTTAAPPTCITNPADNVTSNSARLNGTVNPNGLNVTSCYFDYGTTESYGSQHNAASLPGSGTSPVAVMADISGLSSNTVYNFRCVATNIGGTTQGANRTFGHWSQTTFPSGTGVFTNTQSVDSNVILTSSSNNWIRRYSTTVTPSARSYHAMAYDSVRQKTILFGGWTTGANNETWEWDGTNWTNRSLGVTPPTARYYHAMTYDSLRGVTVLFGGCTTTWNNETWEWDGTNWAQRSPGTSPPARYYHAMVYDSLRQKTVLFGGDSGTFDNETWEWDGTNWTNRSPGGTPPSPRGYHAMAYDSFRQKTVLFGGNDDQTWEWDGTNWLQRYSTTVTPSARGGHAMSYDSLHHRTILFGGWYNLFFNNETWEWDGTNWLQRYSTAVTPSARSSHAMVYDSGRQRTVIFGGMVGGNETWEWSSLYVSSGTYVSESIVPTSISSWDVLTFTYNAPANTTFTVDILQSSDDSVLVINVPSGTDLSTYPALNGVTGIKLRANFNTTNTSITPTLSYWGVGYEGQ